MCVIKSSQYHAVSPFQLDELKQAKDSPIKSVMDKLASARTEASSLSEQLAVSKHGAEIHQKENQRLQKV